MSVQKKRKVHKDEEIEQWKEIVQGQNIMIDSLQNSAIDSLQNSLQNRVVVQEKNAIIIALRIRTGLIADHLSVIAQQLTELKALKIEKKRIDTMIQAVVEATKLLMEEHD